MIRPKGTTSTAKPITAQPKVDLTTSRSSGTYRAARADYEQASDAELRGAIDGLQHALSACDELDRVSSEVCRVIRGDRLQAALDVQAGRVARYRAGAGPNPRTPWSGAWAELAEKVKVDADILRVFDTGGYHLIRHGKEWAGACLRCGGEDRMRVVPEATDRFPVAHAFCRQCGGWWDVIHICRMLITPGYYDAIRHLAEMGGLRVPDPTQPVEPPTPNPSQRATGHAPVPIREGGRRGR